MRRAPLSSPLRRLGERVADTLGHVAARFHEETPLESDLLESQTEYLVIFDAPGATVSDVQAWYEDGGIEVRVDRFRTFDEAYEMRYPGRGLALEGRVDLPEDAVVDPARTTAELKADGTLHVRVPKEKSGDGDDA